MHGNLWRGKQEILIKTSARQMAVWVHNQPRAAISHILTTPLSSMEESFILCRICSFHYKTRLVYVESTLILHCHKQTTQFKPADTQTHHFRIFLRRIAVALAFVSSFLYAMHTH